jgi:hypothetical protein
VSISDEGVLRDRLGAALDRHTPGPAPFDAIVRQGRTAVIRRRLSAAAGIAVCAALAVITPFALRSAGSPPAQHLGTHYRVTVRPPGPGSPAGLVASGTVGRTRWKWTVRRPAGGQDVSDCLTAYGSVNCDGDPLNDQRPGMAGQLAIFGEIGQGPNGLLGVIAAVRADVAELKVGLTNGQTLMLRPVAALGPKHASYVAFAVPASQAVTEIEAFSRHRQIGYTVPFTGLGSVEVMRWLAPGQPALPAPVTYLIGSGSVHGYAWSVRLYVGPWGSCIGGTTVNTDYCTPDSVSQLGNGKAAGVITRAFDVGTQRTYFFVGNAVPSVSRVVISLRDGRSVRPHLLRLPGMSFYAYPSERGNPAIRWAAYDASGSELASGGLAH